LFRERAGVHWIVVLNSGCPAPLAVSAMNADTKHGTTYRLSVYTLGFRATGSLHDVVPRLCGGVVLAADGVRVNVGSCAYGRVAEPLGHGREVHAVGQQEARMAVSQDVERCSLGQAQRPAEPRHRCRH
jgi:hypothetical protein